MSKLLYLFFYANIAKTLLRSYSKLYLMTLFLADNISGDPIIHGQALLSRNNAVSIVKMPNADTSPASKRVEMHFIKV